MDIYGTDIKLDENGNFVATANKDIETISNTPCFIQDIQNEAITYEGDLFYDETYGFSLHDFIHRKGTELDHLELIQRIKDKLSKRELIDVGSINVNIQYWNMNKIGVLVRFKISGLDQEFEIRLSLDRIKVEVVAV